MEKSAIDMSNQDAIHALKPIGRRYNCLADIMDQLNYCYSFQVQ